MELSHLPKLCKFTFGLKTMCTQVCKPSSSLLRLTAKMHIEKGSRVVVAGNVSVGEVEERVELAGCHSVMATAEGGRSWDKKLIGRGGEEGAATSTSKRRGGSN